MKPGIACELYYRRAPENPAAHQTLGKLTLEAGNTLEARDALREARRLNPVNHNDREALAAAYGRLQWPFRVLDRFLLRLHTWTPSRRWLVVAAASTMLLVVALSLRAFPNVTLPLLLGCFNLAAASMTLDQFAIPIGMVAFRKDLDVAWYQLIPQTVRIAFAMFVHGFVSLAAIGCAYSPLCAALVLGFMPHCELILALTRKPSLGESIVFGFFAFFTVFIPTALAAAFLDDSSSVVAALLFWLIALAFSYLFTVYWRLDCQEPELSINERIPDPRPIALPSIALRPCGAGGSARAGGDAA